ncbi:hypothetical protein [Clostridium brassicae]|uniref:Uncharacterized protein n=1 Tax=Clostridium brassicae TaxID=2999072 RepID=A0ABT4D6P0_9CLOT|nr:hypothetical protein [Clostridium brassicae]MCY6957969.1 hypothetical protein [Clostridium brassicae]
MSKETEHLKLFKYDKDTDDFNITTFNINQALNNNWDKVDSGFKKLEESIPEAPVKSVNNKIGIVELTAEDIKCKSGNSIEAQLSDIETKTISEISNLQSQTNSLKTTVDNIEVTAEKTTLSSSKFTSKNVKGALEELFINVDNGKKQLGTTLSTRGITVPNNPTFEQIDNSMKNIDTVIKNNLVEDIIKMYNLDLCKISKQKDGIYYWDTEINKFKNFINKGSINYYKLNGTLVKKINTSNAYDSICPNHDGTFWSRANNTTFKLTDDNNTILKSITAQIDSWRQTDILFSQKNKITVPTSGEHYFYLNFISDNGTILSSQKSHGYATNIFESGMLDTLYVYGKDKDDDNIFEFICMSSSGHPSTSYKVNLNSNLFGDYDAFDPGNSRNLKSRIYCFLLFNAI